MTWNQYSNFFEKKINQCYYEVNKLIVDSALLSVFSVCHVFL